MDEKIEKLEKIREEIKLGEEKMKKAKEAHEKRIAKLQEQFKEKSAKMMEQQRERYERLQEASNTQVLSDVSELNLSPEELKKILRLFKEGKLDGLMRNSEIEAAIKASAMPVVANEKNMETKNGGIN